MVGVDLIGDVHGYADELEQLLEKMGYRCIDGVYMHTSRRAIFVGDLIDRGPQQRRTLQIVQRMVDRGSAQVVMGNHEYNAICYHTLDQNQNPLREHSYRNSRQHKAFLEEYPIGKADTTDVIGWFKQLPLVVELNGVQLVHACWINDYIRRVTQNSFVLSEEQLFASVVEGSDMFNAIEVILKGIEMALPSGYSFQDKDGHRRSRIRIEWWNNRAKSYRDYAALYDDSRQHVPELVLDDHVVDDSVQFVRPTFFGHYWMRGEPVVLSPKAACLDYSIAEKSGDCRLVAYRWCGETELSGDNFIWVKR